MSDHQFLHPPGWPRPKGYSNGIAASGRLVFVAGQIGWDEKEEIVSDDLVQQIRQALRNTVLVLRVAGAMREDVVRMTWFLTDKKGYMEKREEIGEVYQSIMGKHYPAMSVVFVS